MSSRVRILPDEVANQIAAGEVVERPASVLKELVENALDAAATRVSVETSAGGRRLIRVVDDGRGMSPDDLLLCLERHATSKLAVSRDLDAVASLGFRGEALPSIASVSRMLLRSREAGAETGSQVRVEGGSIRQVEEVGSAPGTTVEVADLFFNTPARRKFLRSVNTEQGHLATAFVRLALGWPGVGFRLAQGGQVSWDLPPAADLAVRAAGVLGRRTVEDMLPFRQELDGLVLEGLAGLPGLSRSTPDQIYTFVNHRFVRDRVLLSAVGRAYQGLLAQGRRPVVVLNLELDPGLVDVNVHPAKVEVRFRDQTRVHAAVEQGLRRGLAHAAPPRRAAPAPGPARGSTLVRPGSPGEGPPPPWHSAAPRPASPPPVASAAPSQAFRVAEPSAAAPPPPLPEFLIPAGAVRPRGLFTAAGELTVLGQLHGLYLLCASPEGLVIVDQHAAHERLTYEELKAGLKAAGHAPGQGLLTPLTLELTPAEDAAAREQAPVWARLGLELEPFGGHTWAVRTVPPFWAGSDFGPPLRDLLSEMARSGLPPDTPEHLEACLVSLACRSSIKRGQRLAPAEMAHLVARLGQLPPPVTCPHGRPVFLQLGFADLARYFKRTPAPADHA
ncbi:MAG: DNA mismatch repair endonuclease MutL [Deltaproteobacteria bacterium]|nr:DNA mismatch repair endonuclease MutL [Deltaproteobacteria bacterium]